MCSHRDALTVTPLGIGSARSKEVRFDEDGRPPAGTLVTRPAFPLTGSPSAL